MAGPRRRAREAALQVLYFWEVGRTDPTVALDAFFTEHQADADEATRVFAEVLVRGTIAGLPGIDRLIEEHSANWRMERLAIVDRMILRVAVYEMQHERDTPPAVVLNEAIELARTFSADDSVRFVNGVLDAIRRTLAGETN